MQRLSVRIRDRASKRMVLSRRLGVTECTDRTVGRTSPEEARECTCDKNGRLYFEK